ncbi:ATP-binding protein [Variovorax guangxiensis]|uniref:ATP-binding protein n=1 Tax=Variovorax guangxiensis TaxID=1775474 RepID=UPI00285E212B|nr:ATP-binding protein [Variovorax guangxiensis]MDR6860125.1 two-component system C4-dicarboxylate transport sensor histidine kinase DctB [Variovorax guangxiensis]
MLATYNAVVHSSLDQLRRTSGQRLDFLTAVTGQTLQKYESMPYVLSQQGELIDLLEHPDEARRVQSVNDYLQRVRERTEPLAVYLLNRQGKAIASSNWSEPGTFVGQDYSFRPYFLQAMQSQAGRFYGVGTTTAEPGYFLSYPLFSRDTDASATSVTAQAPLGVVVVKISLGDLEQAWGEGADAVALADADGVVFLSSDSNWRYRTLTPLAADTQERLLQTRQYGDSALQMLPIRPLRPLWDRETPAAARTDLIHLARGGDASALLMQAAEVGPLSWKLVLFSSPEAAFAAARNATVATALALALVALLIITLWLRRSRLQERRAARIELLRINDELEMRITERTQVLVDANTSMESKLSELGEAERMLRATQDHAIQAGKLAVLGQMSAGIVHEIAQPLTAMRILSENARKLLSVKEFAEADDNMIEIGDLCRKAGSIVGELKGFAQKSVETFEPVLVDQITSDAVTLVRRESAGVEFDVRPTSRPVWVSGNSVRLEQVLINLLRNSIDAMKDSANRCISIRMELDERHVVLRVRDTGSGISPEAVQRLFEPFFTTKAPGHGLGLGLAISASIVQAMHGEIRAANHSEGGAEFTLRLPLAPADPEREAIRWN